MNNLERNNMQNKEEQKQHLIDIMRGDEELGLYKDWVKDAEKGSNLSDLNDRANAFWSGYRSGVKSKDKMYTEEDLRRAYNYGMFAVTSGRSFSDWFKERNK
jgi:hypothetical protein